MPSIMIPISIVIPKYNKIPIKKKTRTKMKDEKKKGETNSS